MSTPAGAAEAEAACASSNPFPTERHWRDNSRLEDIDSGLATMMAEVRGRIVRMALSLFGGPRLAYEPGLFPHPRNNPNLCEH